MKTQIKVIRFVAIISILLAVVTYLITVNIEIGFFIINTPWLSNNFVLTVCGGAFASMLVVLLCEIQKYCELKKAIEESIFKRCGYIYVQLVVLQKQIQLLLNEPNEIVPKDILSASVISLKENLTVLSDIEYCTFSRKNNIEKTFVKFCNSTVRDITNWCAFENYLKMAVNSDQINNLKLYGTERKITSSSPITNRALTKLNSKLQPLLSETDVFIQTIDTYCEKRFNWELRRMAMLIGMEQTSFEDFESFIK